MKNKLFSCFRHPLFPSELHVCHQMHIDVQLVPKNALLFGGRHCRSLVTLDSVTFLGVFIFPDSGSMFIYFGLCWVFVALRAFLSSGE